MTTTDTLASKPYFALLDDADTQQAALLTDWQATDTLAAAVKRLDACLHAGWQRGWHAFLVLPYAVGQPWQKTLANGSDEHPIHIHWFACKQLLPPGGVQTWLQQWDDGMPAGVANLYSDTSQAEYLAAIARIQTAIACGDTYQINYTTRLRFTAYGHPCTLYQRLRTRQPAPYGALTCLPHGSQPQWTLCFSPELFLALDGCGHIRTQPMKGTAPMLHDGADDARAQALRNDAKNRAENVMIVDLLRNDLGKIAQTGSVRVPEAFAVRAHGQVWQMTSTVTAQLRQSTTLAEVLQATFPCGSITGAPKRMSMSLIDGLENSPRGLYTGSIGHLMPASGAPACCGSLNVVIRTLQLTPAATEYCGEMGVGSGIVADSDAAAEYEECQWKSRFLTTLPPQFGLIETLRVEYGHCALLEQHIQRLTHSARILCLPVDASTVRTHIQAALAALPPHRLFRLRITLHPESGWHCEHAPLPTQAEQQTVLLHPDHRINAGFLSRHKTTHRAIYDAAWRSADALGAFDTVLFDRAGHLLEGGRSNVFVRVNGEWHTPSLQHPLLNGVMRQAVLAEPLRWLGTTHIHQSSLQWCDVANAEAWVLTNAVRGVIPVTPVHHTVQGLQTV